MAGYIITGRMFVRENSAEFLEIYIFSFVSLVLKGEKNMAEFFRNFWKTTNVSR